MVSLAVVGMLFLPLANSTSSNIGIVSVTESVSRRDRTCKGRWRALDTRSFTGEAYGNIADLRERWSVGLGT